MNKLCYHGTTKENAEKILSEGFKPDCWFARHIEDAIQFGGTFIFAVPFETKKMPRSWQFHVLESIPKTKIIYLLEVKDI